MDYGIMKALEICRRRRRGPRRGAGYKARSAPPARTPWTSASATLSPACAPRLDSPRAQGRHFILPLPPYSLYLPALIDLFAAATRYAFPRAFDADADADEEEWKSGNVEMSTEKGGRRSHLSTATERGGGGRPSGAAHVVFSVGRETDDVPALVVRRDSEKHFALHWRAHPSSPATPVFILIAKSFMLTPPLCTPLTPSVLPSLMHSIQPCLCLHMTRPTSSCHTLLRSSLISPSATCPRHLSSFFTLHPAFTLHFTTPRTSSAYAHTYFFVSRPPVSSHFHSFLFPLPPLPRLPCSLTPSFSFSAVVLSIVTCILRFSSLSPPCVFASLPSPPSSGPLSMSPSHPPSPLPRHPAIPLFAAAQCLSPTPRSASPLCYTLLPDVP
ncbi:hypothetical protein DFH06DRAFT_1328393 [Mycena polygramma]|nr:hypothetical protein DFH06DRAFT_1328393 [Mycena polygramma]